jgi:hypothetical protein
MLESSIPESDFLLSLSREHHPQVKIARNAERCAFIKEISAAR